jgi:hypothetical protein
MMKSFSAFVCCFYLDRFVVPPREDGAVILLRHASFRHGEDGAKTDEERLQKERPSKVSLRKGKSDK